MTRSKLTALFLPAICLAIFGCGGMQHPHLIANDATRIHFADANRDFVIGYAAERGVPVLAAYEELVSSVLDPTVRDGVELEFAAVGAVHAMRSDKQRSGSTHAQSWTHVMTILRDQGLVGSGLLGGIASESSDDEDEGCSCECDVYYTGSCGSQDCKLCSECCDTSCDTKCAESTGCNDCVDEIVGPEG